MCRILGIHIVEYVAIGSKCDICELETVGIIFD